ASGLDTDMIIKELMQAERIPVDKLYQQKQIIQWQQEDYRELNRSFLAFRNTVFDMRLQGAYLSKKVNSSNENVLKVSATTAAAEGIYELGIKQLARGAMVISAEAVAEESEVSADGTIRTLTLAEQFGLEDEIVFTLEGMRDGENGYKQSGEIVIKPEDTIYTLVAKINDASAAAQLGIRASYDSVNNLFVITSTTTGADQHIAIKEAGGTNFFSDSLKMKSFTSDGLDAEITLNGSDNVYRMPANSFSLLGMSFELKEGPADPANPIKVTVAVSKDIDGVLNKIKDFISAYNDLLAKVNEKLAEKRYYDYPPLTEEQKKEMSEREIELWEEKARSGLLKSDRLLSDLVSRLRLTMAAVIPDLGGSYTSLVALGINTANYYEGGKLHIDESKLRQALENDPEAVMALFTRAADDYDRKGVAHRLYDEVNRAISIISERAGRDWDSEGSDMSFLGLRLRELDQQIYRSEERLRQVEERYWRQFTMLEKAISRMNSQSAWLAQLFNQGQG
ncbi:MAG: flagellar filament capping protein FliD, partial [Clostridia bacterium]|nr:flagellar filament capping protein FliD [Clostridia bacterium]